MDKIITDKNKSKIQAYYLSRLIYEHFKGLHRLGTDEAFEEAFKKIFKEYEQKHFKK